MKPTNEQLDEWLPIAERIARGHFRRLPQSVDHDSLISAAKIGAWDALHRCSDPKFVKCRIRGAIVDELRRQDWSPRHRRTNGTAPTVVGFGDLRRDRTREHHDPDATTEVPDPSPSPEEQAMRRDTVRTVKKALKALTKKRPIRDIERERAVVHGFYFRGTTQEELAAEHGVSAPRVSQILTQARDRMREALEPAPKRAEVVRDALGRTFLERVRQGASPPVKACPR
jgi:RNA polymerase sigma factor (sigma-70 family)